MSTADDAWQDFIKGNEGGEFPGEENAFLAGYRRALEEAANAMEAPTGSVCDWGHKTEDDCNGECSLPDEVTPMVSAKWLRDRADRVDAEDGGR